MRIAPFVTSTHKQRSGHSFTNVVGVHESIGISSIDVVHSDPSGLEKQLLHGQRGGDILVRRVSITKIATSQSFLSSHDFASLIDYPTRFSIGDANCISMQRDACRMHAYGLIEANGCHAISPSIRTLFFFLSFFSSCA